MFAFHLVIIKILIGMLVGTLVGLSVSVVSGFYTGSLLGVRLSTALPRQWLRRVLCLIIFVSGARMLWV